jgi:hypothetical protein
MTAGQAHLSRSTARGILTGQQSPASSPEVSFVSEPAHVLVVAHRTAATSALLAAVGERARRSPATFHLVVPREQHGMHKVMDPQDTSDGEAQGVLADALPKLSGAAGREVTGSVGDSEPLMAIQDAIHLGTYDEIIISTLPPRVSRWLKLDLVSKCQGLGLPVTHVEDSSGDSSEVVNPAT